MMRIVWILLCCIGCIAHISLLVIQYMNYDISTSVTYTFEDIIHLPSITVCGNILELANWDDEKMRRHCDDLTGSLTCMNDTSDQIAAFVANNVSLGQRLPLSLSFMDYFTMSEMMKGTHDVDKLILGYMRFNPLTGDNDRCRYLSDTFDIVHYVTGIYKCMTISWKKPYDVVNFLKLKRQFTSSGMFLFLVRNEFLMHKASMLIVGYSSNHVIPRNGDSDSIIIAADKDISSSSYDLLKNKFLEAPFATNCIDYKKMYGLESRTHCYDSCFKRACVQRLNRMPIGVLMSDNDNGNIMSMSDSFIAERNEEINKMSQECDNLCSRQDCRQIVYAARMKSTTRGDNGTISGHVSYVPNAPIVVTECLQKVTFAEFATDLGSTFGFWLGLSVLSAFSWVQCMLQKIVSNKRPWSRSVISLKEDQVTKRTIVKRRKPDKGEWVYVRGIPQQFAPRTSHSLTK